MTADFNQLHASLVRVMLRDRHALRRRLRGIERSAQANRATDHALAAVALEIERSMNRRAHRQRNLPKPTYPDNLPVVEKRDDIKQAIAKNQVVVLCGE